MNVTRCDLVLDTPTNVLHMRLQLMNGSLITNALDYLMAILSLNTDCSCMILTLFLDPFGRPGAGKSD
jgi:hypothetical protein